MRKKKTITLASKPTDQGYSHGFEIAIIERIENGQLSINQAAKEYDVSRSGVQKWIKKYGNLDRKLRNMQDERMSRMERMTRCHSLMSEPDDHIRKGGNS